MYVYNFVLAQAAQKLQLQVQTNIRFTKKNGDIKLWRLVTFESLGLEQTYTHKGIVADRIWHISSRNGRKPKSAYRILAIIRRSWIEDAPKGLKNEL